MPALLCLCWSKELIMVEFEHARAIASAISCPFACLISNVAVSPVIFAASSWSCVGLASSSSGQQLHGLHPTLFEDVPPRSYSQQATLRFRHQIFVPLLAFYEQSVETGRHRSPSLPLPASWSFEDTWISFSCLIQTYGYREGVLRCCSCQSFC